MEWERARREKQRRSQPPAKKKPKTIAVHPNSMAARKWRRTEWTSYL